MVTRRVLIAGVLLLVSVLSGSGEASGSTPRPDPADVARSVHGIAAAIDGDVSGQFRPPAPLEVLTEFITPVTRYSAGHRGVDLAVALGAEVTAAGSGTVIYAGHLVDRGVVSIEHAGGLRTTYEPVSAHVVAGQWVDRGDVIGTVESGHPSCQPAICLHLGARLPDRVYLDPLALFRVWQVRLKPWAGMAR